MQDDRVYTIELRNMPKSTTTPEEKERAYLVAY
jgi:hypothetical protein